MLVPNRKVGFIRQSVGRFGHNGWDDHHQTTSRQYDSAGCVMWPLDKDKLRRRRCEMDEQMRTHYLGEQATQMEYPQQNGITSSIIYAQNCNNQRKATIVSNVDASDYQFSPYSDKSRRQNHLNAQQFESSFNFQFRPFEGFEAETRNFKKTGQSEIKIVDKENNQNNNYSNSQPKQKPRLQGRSSKGLNRQSIKQADRSQQNKHIPLHQVSNTINLHPNQLSFKRSVMNCQFQYRELNTMPIQSVLSYGYPQQNQQPQLSQQHTIKPIKPNKPSRRHSNYTVSNDTLRKLEQNEPNQFCERRHKKHRKNRIKSKQSVRQYQSQGRLRQSINVKHSIQSQYVCQQANIRHPSYSQGSYYDPLKNQQLYPSQLADVIQKAPLSLAEMFERHCHRIKRNIEERQRRRQAETHQRRMQELESVAEKAELDTKSLIGGEGKKGTSGWDKMNGRFYRGEEWKVKQANGLPNQNYDQSRLSIEQSYQSKMLPIKQMHRKNIEIHLTESVTPTDRPPLGTINQRPNQEMETSRIKSKGGFDHGISRMVEDSRIDTPLGGGLNISLKMGRKPFLHNQPTSARSLCGGSKQILMHHNSCEIKNKIGHRQSLMSESSKNFLQSQIQPSEGFSKHYSQIKDRNHQSTMIESNISENKNILNRRRLSSTHSWMNAQTSQSNSRMVDPKDMYRETLSRWKKLPQVVARDEEHRRQRNLRQCIAKAKAHDRMTRAQLRNKSGTKAKRY